MLLSPRSLPFCSVMNRHDYPRHIDNVLVLQRHFLRTFLFRWQVLLAFQDTQSTYDTPLQVLSYFLLFYSLLRLPGKIDRRPTKLAVSYVQREKLCHECCHFCLFKYIDLRAEHSTQTLMYVDIPTRDFKVQASLCIQISFTHVSKSPLAMRRRYKRLCDVLAITGPKIDLGWACTTAHDIQDGFGMFTRTRGGIESVWSCLGGKEGKERRRSPRWTCDTCHQASKGC